MSFTRLLAVPFLFLTVCFGQNQESMENGTAQPGIQGHVTDALTGEALSGAHILALPSGPAASSDARGAFHLHLQAGQYTIQASCMGYRSRKVTVVVAQRDTLLEFPLVSASAMLDEITVVAHRTPLTYLPALGGTQIAPAEISDLTGAFGDPSRVLQAMPGVTSNNEMSSHFSVRGGGTNENLVLIDGAEVLEPFHVKESPNSSLSIVNAALLQRITFIPGGFPARYGDRLSSVLDLVYREGNPDRFAGQLDASLSDGGLTLEGPLSDFARGLVSFRSTYSGYLNNYLADGNGRSPSFYDVQGTAGADISDANHASTQFLYSRDHTSGIANGNYGTAMVSILDRHILSQNSILAGSVSYYHEDLDLTLGSSLPSGGIGPVQTARNDISLRQAKVQLDTRLTSWYSAAAGIELQDYSLGVRTRALPSSGSSPAPIADGALTVHSTKTAAYVENLFQVNSSILINGGMRLDHSALTQETAVSPRLLAAYVIPRGPTLHAAWGLYYQTPGHDQLLAAAQAGLPPQGMQRATHYVLGLQHVLRQDVTFRLSLYRKDLENLISYTREPNGVLVFSPRNDAVGQIHGAEFELSVKDERVMAWINVGLMKARQNNLFDNKGWRYLPSDQAKTVTAVFEYRIGRRWLANLRAYYGSGYAYGDNLPGTVSDNRLHYPDYKRADARVQFSFPLTSLDCAVYLEVMNLFNFRNAYSFSGSTNNTPDLNLLVPRVANIGTTIRL